MLNFFDLAILELQRENVDISQKNYADLLIDRIKKIRKYFDNIERNKKVLEARYNKV